jgi:ADP-ribose pyrophosphatase YjhB (NUDIX family)
MPHGPRVIALALIRRDDEILVFEARDSKKGETFYRPLGGAVGFGEGSRDAVARELREEIGADLKGVRFLTTIENIFEHEGEKGHEIVLMYEAEFADETLYRKREFVVTEDSGERLPAKWMRLSFFRDGKAPLYPEGLLEFIDLHGRAFRRRKR